MKRYPKIYRIQIDSFSKRGKRYLTSEEARQLLDGHICVEEKIDGKLVETPSLIESDYVTFYEDMKRRHTVAYTDLPAWLIGIDVWIKGGFLSRRDKELVFIEFGTPIVPLLFQGEVPSAEPLLEFLGKPSAYNADRIEGLVIKNNDKQLMGKIVDPVFDKKVDILGHHLRRPFVRNWIRQYGGS